MPTKNEFLGRAQFLSNWTDEFAIERPCQNNLEMLKFLRLIVYKFKYQIPLQSLKSNSSFK